MDRAVPAPPGETQAGPGGADPAAAGVAAGVAAGAAQHSPSVIQAGPRGSDPATADVDARATPTQPGPHRPGPHRPGPHRPGPNPHLPQAGPGDLADLASGPPCIWVWDGVALGDPPLALPVWRVTPRAGHAVLHRPGAAPPTATLPLPAVPGAVLALVAPNPDGAGPCAPAGTDPPAALHAWFAAAGVALPLLRAATLAGVATPLLGAALDRLRARDAETAGLHRALAVLRAESEATRQAQAALRRSLGAGAHPPSPTLAAGAAPDPSRRVAARAGRLRLGLAPGRPVDGIAAVELHLAQVQAGPAAVLRLRLLGAESGRVLGAWYVPGPALAPGWLMFDLPAALPPRGEGLALDLDAELVPGEVLALSLEAAATPPGAPWSLVDGVLEGPGAVEAAGAGPGAATLATAAPALRLWTAPPGGRTTLAEHWDPDGLDLPLPPPGANAPIDLPRGIWARCGTPADAPADLGTTAIGPAAPRPRVTLRGGAATRLVLPAVPLAGLDRLRATLAVPLGDAGALEAALWVLPAAVGARADGAGAGPAPGTAGVGTPEPGGAGPGGAGMGHAGVVAAGAADAEARARPGDAAMADAGVGARPGDAAMADPEGGAGPGGAAMADPEGGAGPGGAGGGRAGVGQAEARDPPWDAAAVDPADLDPGLPGLRGSGWRGADALTGGLTVTLAIGAAPRATVVLALRHRGPDGADPLTVAWTDLLGLRTRHAPAAASRSPGASDAPGAGFAAPATGLGATHLLETYAMNGGRYRHLDLLLEGVRHGAEAWPRLRLKFAIADGLPRIELRDLPDWPALFRHWPGTLVDAHGRLFTLDAADLRGGALAGLGPRDQRLLRAMLAVLPAAVATAARDVADGPADHARWVAAARDLAAAAG